jgi:prepilin-type N-terminal cleavage/methylation domain-containing protein
MTLNNIKKMKNEKGFTIVELLIVIVVIGILAAIVIVAYNGVQNKANTTKAQTNAAAVQKVAEAYNADNSRYPGTLTELNGGSTSVKLPTGVTGVSGTTSPTYGLTTGNAKTSVAYRYKGAVGAATGGEISFWDFSTGTASTTVIYVGDGKSGDTFAQAL